jgi:hypothetical protein
VRPNYLTERFHRLVQRFDLPPVRLHDLRHGAASLAHSAGADLKTVQDQLGHASIVLTADTYTSVLPTAQFKAADATARLVLNAARAVRGGLHRSDHAAAARSTEPEAPRPGEPPARTAWSPRASSKKAAKRTKRSRRRARHRAAKS